MAAYLSQRFGWHRDLPDHRDYTSNHDQVVRRLSVLEAGDAPPKHLDLREYCPRVDDQGPLASSAAHACVALLRYFERRSTGLVTEPSPMFVYRTARRLLGWRGDSGASLRATWKAIARFGAPPEEYWPHDPQRLDEEPDAFTYALARPFERLWYVRLDGRRKRSRTIHRVRSFLASGFACVFGFSVSTAVTHEPDIPFPTVFDRIRGGQAVMAVGYDDTRWVRSDKGALLIRNSWGPEWGDCGYGWLPYAYIRERLAADFWTVMSMEWLQSGEFARPQ